MEVTDEVTDERIDEATQDEPIMKQVKALNGDWPWSDFLFEFLGQTNFKQCRMQYRHLPVSITI